MSTDRYARQRLLVELGELGQEKLGRAELLLSPRLAPEVRRAARLYGDALGFLAVQVDDSAENLTFRHQTFFRHSSSAAIGHGAHLALERAREVLDLPAPSHR